MTHELENIEKELGKLPDSVLEEFRSAWDLLSDILGDEELLIWAREGLEISRQSARSGEVLVECFRASPHVAKYLTLPTFLQWLRSGRNLCSEVPSLAAAYFRAGPETISNIRPRNIERWASLGRNLYNGTWNSTTLATRFFHLSPELLKHVSFWDLEFFASVLDLLLSKSSDLAYECLNEGVELLSNMGKEREAFLSLCRTLAETSWRDMRDVLGLTPGIMAHLEDDQRERLFRLVEQVVRSGKQDVPRLLREISRTLEKIPAAQRENVLDQCDQVMSINGGAVICLLRSLPQVLECVGSWEKVALWVHMGVSLLRSNTEGGLSYLRLESNTSEQFLEALSSTLELERVQHIMQMYCRALSGEQIEITSAQELADRGIGWVAESMASTDGSKIYLPSQVDRYQEKKRNFSWIKVVATHQTGHLEFNSFGLVFGRPSSLFQDLRWEVEKDGNGLLPRGAPNEGSNGSTIATDMGRFFGLFEERQLALDVFTAIEDSRLDHRIKAEYPGLASTYSQAQKEALSERPSVEMLPLRQALIELLIRLSLDQHERSPVPKDYVREVTLLFRIMARLRNVEATVEDSAEATLRVYAILSRLPNEKIDSEGWEYQDADMSQEYSEEEFKDLMEEIARRQGETSAGNGEEVPYDSPEEVDFRGGFKPEMVQILSQLRMLRPDEVSKEELEELLKQSVELETGSEETQSDGELQELVQNLMKEAGKDLDRKEEGRGDGPIGHVEEQGGPLDARDDLTAAYDEWDFRAGDYKPRWCMVHERRIEEGDSRFFEGVLKEHASLMSEIKRQFEMVLPEQLRRIRRVEDGEDLELDAAIEAEIDRRSGSTPSEKVYWRRNKVERDVAVAFLVDMSASTAEAVEEVQRNRDLSGAPPGPAASVQRQQKSGGRRNYKRIIDLEKESTALLIQALETIGDTYGIYGFSGYGRENVEFYVIKDVNEGYSDKVKRRLDKMSPLHATRMGPAIRHAISKLEKQESKTKFLFLISDGRPQDRGYSREGVERDYAVHDTHMALLEARQKDITPFCLTVDKNGHDYLKAMCGDMGYEVLTDIYALPRRLPMLYKSLTM